MKRIYIIKYDDKWHEQLRERMRHYRARHPDKVKEQNRKSRARHKEAHIERAHRYSKEHPLSAIHGSMMKRCGHRAGKSAIERRYYEGEGVTVCDEWRSFPSFERWALENGYKKGLQIDRIDWRKGYSPDNCRFVTPHENALNRRNTIRVSWHGETIELMRLHERLKPPIPYSVVYDRFHNGWNVEDALFTPKKREAL